jgi:hypothetical protein
MSLNMLVSLDTPVSFSTIVPQRNWSVSVKIFSRKITDDFCNAGIIPNGWVAYLYDSNIIQIMILNNDSNNKTTLAV